MRRWWGTRRLASNSTPNRATRDLRFERTAIDGAGITRYGFLAFEATRNGAPAVVCAPAITGVTRENFALDYSGDSLEDRFDVRSSC